MRVRKLTFRGLTALLLLGGAWTVAACSVPVFRYALERWPPDDYEGVIFHRGPLSPELSALADRIDPDRSTNQVLPNLRVQRVDLDAQPEESMLALWKGLQTETLPLIAVVYPRSTGLAGAAWVGPFNEATVAALVDSPVRRDIARRILGGDTAVWVLLGSGDKEKDAAVAGFLAKRLEKLGKELQLPTLEQEDAGLVSQPEAELKVAFSSIRLARDDPAEAVLVRMLLGSETDLKEIHEPIVFPIFGRGRALFALVGKGINEDNVDEAGLFLVGPCSCQVKELNPGVDLLMSVNWDESIQSQMLLERELPPLSGFAGMGAGPERAASGSEVAGGRTEPAVSAVDKEAMAAPAASPTPAGTGVRSAPPLMPRLVLVGLVGLVLVGGATLVVVLRK